MVPSFVLMAVKGDKVVTYVYELRFYRHSVLDALSEMVVYPRLKIHNHVSLKNYSQTGTRRDGEVHVSRSEFVKNKPTEQ